MVIRNSVKFGIGSNNDGSGEVVVEETVMGKLFGESLLSEG